MKRFVPASLLWIVILAGPATVFAQPLPDEPPLSTRIGWEVHANGLLHVEYDLNGNGKPDYITVRSLRQSYHSFLSLAVEARMYRGHPIFAVPYTAGQYVYIAQPLPLFYAWDPDEDGDWDLVYQDVLEDGVNGNEKRFPQPGGRTASTGKNLGQTASLFFLRDGGR